MSKKKIIFIILVILLVIISSFFIININFNSKNNNSSEPTKTQEEINPEEEKAKEEVKESEEEIKDEEKEEIVEIEKQDSTIEENKEETKEEESSSNETTTEKLPEDIPSKLELKKYNNLEYYLYIPSNPTSNMPLIIYLHGGTNKNLNATSLLTTDGFPKYLNDGYYKNLRSYVLIPKLTSNYTGWVDISNTINSLIKNLHNGYGINLNKVSLTGHSMGGTGTYQLQVKLPNTFACIAPMSGSIKNTKANISALSKTKIWAFIGSNDTIVDPLSTKTIIEELNKINANVKLTEFKDTDHFGVPKQGYQNTDVINWLQTCSK